MFFTPRKARKANDDICLDIDEKYRITDEEARNIIRKACKVQNTPELQSFDILKTVDCRGV